jgi:antitoxin HigA-1
MEMFNPPHPGEIIREDCLAPAGLSVTEAAMRLGVSRQSVSELINGRNGISADMALRLEKAGWGPALSWLRNQVSYDLWQARNRDEAPDQRTAQRMRRRVHRKTTAEEQIGLQIKRLKRQAQSAATLKLNVEPGAKKREPLWKKYHAAGAGFRAHGSGRGHGFAGAKKSAAKRSAKKSAAKRR